MRALSVLGLGCAFLLVVVACGGGGGTAEEKPDAARSTDAAVPDAATCGPSNCSGCCAGNVCKPGTSSTACGEDGAACSACTGGSTCSPLVHTCAGANDPCNGVGPEGICTSSSTVTFCSSSTGNGSTTLQTYTCQQGEQCQQSAAGASCVLTAACHEDDTQCLGPTTLRTCQGGNWVSSTCPRQCIGSPIGDFCGINESTQTRTATLKYEARGLNASPPTDWGPLVAVPAQGFLVVVARFDATGKFQQFIDSKLTAAGGGSPGAFSVLVPSIPQANDYILFMAVGTTPNPTTGSPEIAYAIADPNLAASGTPYSIGSIGTAPGIWQWSIAVNSVTDGSTVTIRDSNFSGAARVLDYARYIFALNRSRFAGIHPFIVWLGQGVQWSCGACAWSVPTTKFATTFESQIFLRGGTDQGYWADSVTAHELGHWTMASFGRHVGEGGQHCVGVASAPGLAWSEGYATWYSSDARFDPVYADKQCFGSSCSFFWFDISQRTSSGIPWPRPNAGAGLGQDIYENEVSSMMWNMSSVQGVGRGPFDLALASPRMNVPPFARGYTVHDWDISGCQRTNIEDTGISTIHFADFLDALVCGGVSAAVVNNATNPTVNYPYPSGAPLCGH